MLSLTNRSPHCTMMLLQRGATINFYANKHTFWEHKRKLHM